MNLRIAGVPEHFNLPWKRAANGEKLKESGIKIDFLEYPGGTGAMCNALEAGEVDVALLLTEGAVARALNNNSKNVYVEKFKIAGLYVESPLVWGVHVGVDSSFSCLKDLTTMDKSKSPIFAISRYGSGSHLMSYVLMQQLTGRKDLDLDFEVVKNISGAKEALPKNGRLVFMWEHFMTAPLVDQRVFKRVGDQPTPWPCFVIAVRDGVLSNNASKKIFSDLISVVREECKIFKNGAEESVAAISSTFKLEEHLAREWLKTVNFKCEIGVEEKIISSVADTLFSLGRVDKDPSKEEKERIMLSFSSSSL